MFHFLRKHQGSEKQALFAVPTPDPFENPLVETHPGQLRQWAASLPFANPQQLAESVITSLGRLNRYPRQVKKRDELMEIYRTPSARITQTAAGKKATVPAELNRRLMQEMATGYLHIINDFIRTKSAGRKRNLLRDSIYHAVKFLTLEYLFACEMYDCRHSDTRRGLLRLHSFAEEQGLHREPVEDIEQTAPAMATISHQTKRTLLLFLLDPCHLQKGETRLAFDYLNDFADAARFEPLAVITEPAGHYVIDRLGELAPHLYDPDSSETLTSPRFCLFNLIPISQQLHQHLRAIEKRSSDKPAALQQLTTKEVTNLIRRMLKSWHIRLERDSERHKTSGETRIWMGLTSIHHYLTEKTAQAPSPHEEIEAIDVTQVAGDLGAHSAAPHPPLSGWRFNQSRSGVAVHLPLTSAGAHLVGEIVLITKPNTDRRTEWKIGIVRRALQQQDSLLEIGVQFINGRIVPLLIQPLNMELTEDQQPPTHTAIYIDLGDVERSSMIAPRDALQVGMEYRVEEMVPAPIISPVHLAEVTAMFERFRVKRI